MCPGEKKLSGPPFEERNYTLGVQCAASVCGERLPFFVEESIVVSKSGSAL